MAETDVKKFDFGSSRSIENAFQNMWFASIHQWLVSAHFFEI